jgi:acyl-CoA synthetase (AMP-forming)/AMP-acid ligase II
VYSFSGTTGSPKGVMNSHLNVGTMHNIVCEHFRRHIYPHMKPPFVASEENALLLLPFFHCYGFGMLNQCLLNGSTGVVMAGFDGDLFCKSVQHFKVVHIGAASGAD